MLLRPLRNLTQLLCCMSWNIDPIVLLFTARANASKVALVHPVARLKAGGMLPTSLPKAHEWSW